jgi:hypothetical protein
MLCFSHSLFFSSTFNLSETHNMTMVSPHFFITYTGIRIFINQHW